MGGFFGLGNSSAKTDRGRALGGWNAMWDTWSRAIGAFDPMKAAGDNITKAGTNFMDNAGDFWKSILGGDKSAVASAAAPAVNAAAGMAQQGRQEQAQMGTARGGGTAGFNIDATQQAQGNIIDALLGLAPTAASQVGQLGETMAGVGTRQLALALESLGVSRQTAQGIVETSMQSRNDSYEQSPARIGETIGLSLFGF